MTSPRQERAERIRLPEANVSDELRKMAVALDWQRVGQAEVAGVGQEVAEVVAMVVV